MMSFSFPAKVEADIRQFALDAHLSLGEAATQLMQQALAREKSAHQPGELTESEWTRLREADAAFEVFEQADDHVVNAIESASQSVRSEVLHQRG